jgi:alanine dehydrogenase
MYVGLPRMHKERGERRDFLPDLVAFLDGQPVEGIILEEGYGAAMGVSQQSYARASSKVAFSNLDHCLAQDVVVVLRCPAEEALRRLRPKTLLVTMLHAATRPDRIELLARLGVSAVSLDRVIDDDGNRLVEDLEGVAWNGMRVAFEELARSHPRWEDVARGPLRATVLGAGAVGALATRAATRYGNDARRARMSARGLSGVEVTVVDLELSSDEAYMRERLASSDLLVDATARRDLSVPVIPNEWLGVLPEHAVILDLAADPYDLDGEAPKTKGVEGVPHGDLDRYVFRPRDPIYDEMDGRIPTKHRRIAVSCYSWPGLEPRRCMERYGRQLRPLLGALLGRPVLQWGPIDASRYERALARARLEPV